MYVWHDLLFNLNSSNLETSKNTSSSFRYGGLSEYWSWTTNETVAVCSICWGGNILNVSLLFVILSSCLLYFCY